MITYRSPGTVTVQHLYCSGFTPLRPRDHTEYGSGIALRNENGARIHTRNEIGALLRATYAYVDPHISQHKVHNTFSEFRNDNVRPRVCRFEIGSWLSGSTVHALLC